MKSKEILIVEDDPIVSLSLKHVLRSWGFEAAVVPSGEEALVFVKGCAGLGLILMDIRLKGELDGIETAGMIRRDSDIPVIFLTAYVDPQIIKRIGDSGAFGYLEKPYNNEELKEIISRVL